MNIHTVPLLLLFLLTDLCHSAKVTLYTGKNYTGSKKTYSVRSDNCVNVDFWFHPRSMDLQRGCVVLFESRECNAAFGMVIPYFEGRPFLPLMDRRVGSIGGCRKFFKSWIRNVGEKPKGDF